MGIIMTCVFFLALLYYLIEYIIRFVRFLTRLAGNKVDHESEAAIRPDSSGEEDEDDNEGIREQPLDEDMAGDIPDKLLNIVFSGGEAEIDAEVTKLSILLQKLHPEELVRRVLVSSSLYFARSEDKSEGKLMGYCQKVSHSRLTAQEGKILHDFIYARALRVQFFSGVDESYFNDCLNDIDELTGCDADEIPGGTGAFGFMLSNPIPVKGIISNEFYLNRLRTLDGARITWHRIGSQLPFDATQPVDHYQLFDLEGNEIAQLYLSPYHKRVSNKAPEGFKLLTKADSGPPGPHQRPAHFSEPAENESAENNPYPASFIVITTDQDGNEENEVYDVRLLSASSDYLAGLAAILIPDLAQAKLNLRRAVTNLDSFAGPDDAKTIRLLHNISQLAQKLNDADTAERFLVRALEAQEKRSKTDLELLADIQYDLGLLLLTKSDLPRAETLFREALEIRQSRFGLEHHKTAQALLALGRVLILEPFTEETEQVFRQALAIFSKLYGEEHPETAGVLDLLARTLFKGNKTQEALPLAEKAYAIHTSTDTPGQWVAASSLSTLALIYQQHGRLSEAETLQRQLLTMLEDAYGPEHPAIGVQLDLLAGVVLEKGEIDEAMALLYRALYIKEEGMDSDRPVIATTLMNLASLHARKGEITKANAFAKRAYQIRAKELGDFDPQTQESFALLQQIRASQTW